MWKDPWSLAFKCLSCIIKIHSLTGITFKNKKMTSIALTTVECPSMDMSQISKDLSMENVKNRLVPSSDWLRYIFVFTAAAYLCCLKKGHQSILCWKNCFDPGNLMKLNL